MLWSKTERGSKDPSVTSHDMLLGKAWRLFLQSLELRGSILLLLIMETQKSQLTNNTRWLKGHQQTFSRPQNLPFIFQRLSRIFRKLHKITFGKPSTHQYKHDFLCPNNYWQAHSLVTTFGLVSLWQKQYQRTWLRTHPVQKTLSLQWCALARQTSTFSFPNMSSRKEVQVPAQTAKNTTQSCGAIFTTWLDREKKKDNVQAALPLREHDTASALVLSDWVVNTLHKWMGFVLKKK